ncbi:hypothetical protein SAMN05216376_111119 [Mameliella alba]|uniref:hypothetical protein n=1 Tax=Mameliella alba TaxID=561184 RepID=UPI0008857A67|nr:hypothetical protein [Mameliella alba]OWV46493.1 hypothetical protein CDZ96_17945 [Mameliella alba]PTR37305.1 hypothetical protein LX94_03644 [Mameliella alba]GGF73679.1 hypothetical protein GCM10011319_37760 [Mameliella alba]SDD76227.1 hypothetical protein SAMN05216376_111119 [Mameliella alba]
MANIHDCLDRAVEDGELDKTRADEAAREYDQLLARYESVMPGPAAEAAALADLKEATRRQARSRRHTVLNQLQAMRRLTTLIGDAPDPALAIRDLIEHSETSGFAGESIRSLSDAYIQSVNFGIQDALTATGRDVLGRSRDKALLQDVLRELHLEDTGSAKAKELADAVRRQQERLRQAFNDHGGDIGKLDDYGVTHTHDHHVIQQAGFDTWSTFIRDKLDWSRIEDRATGKPFVAEKGELPDAETATVFLREIYNGIVTQGWNKREPSMAVGGKALYNTRADARVLHFRDGSNWLDYNARFGSGDPFSSLIGGLHGMARDIAQMRVLGPNPKLGLEYAVQVAQKRVAGKSQAEIAVGKKAALARTMLSHFDGSVNNTENEALARFFSNTRSAITSAKLGAAILSAPTDLVTVSKAARIAGMKPQNVLGRAVQLAASAGDRKMARRAGYVAETLADTGAAGNRYLAQQMTSETIDRLTSFTIRASGLSYWTDMLKTAFRLEFAGYLAQNADRALDEVDAPLAKILQDRGITPADWDLLRAPEGRFVEQGGGDFLSPVYWLEHQSSLPRTEAEGLALRLQMMIEEQLEYAVPTMRLEGRARTVGDTRPGTFAGELLRSSTMFKGFALSLTIGQYRRFVALPTGTDRAIYAAQMVVGLTLLGALSVQLKELSKARDPRPMDSGAFWAAAVAQGGGLGIFGDFFAAETNRFGGGLGETIAGPMIGLGGDVINLGASNAARAFAREDTFLGRDVANFARYNTPVASSLWYQRAAFDRIVADQLQAFLDPEAEAVWERQEANRERNYGTRTWWERGKLAPERAPDMTNVIGGAR